VDNFTVSLEDHSNTLSLSTLQKESAKHLDILKRVVEGEDRYQDSLGWKDVEKWAGSDTLERLQLLSEELREKVDTLVVVGIGGSNQGARAILSALDKQGPVEILWGGTSLSSYETEKLLESLQGKTFAIDVIAKNFETLEPGVGFRLLRKELQKRYGKAAKDYIYITGTPGSYLEEISRKEGYTFLTFPGDIGGRYSVFSEVGLFPLSVAGVDLAALMGGAKSMQAELTGNLTSSNLALQYATTRNYLNQKGFKNEMLSFFEPRLFYFGSWWKQLMAESEGKDGKGLFPVSSSCSEDLHSTGQFLQDGETFIFETFIRVLEDGSPAIPFCSDAIEDNFGYLDGKTLSEVNRIAEEATIAAHSSKFPCNLITVEKLDEYGLGCLLYFFMFACYISGSILGINPFDQPGVEAYKGWMFKGLGK
jgi:glucose-6-phosphate isomerase